jgi:hypothetical protein
VIAARSAFKLPFTKLEEVMVQDALAKVLRIRREAYVTGQAE